ncbi:MAG TPA: hemerythrin domain-containing protein [Bryobacteraceae bacterium]|nr:hemerythrin domain-containing protein [Bryobacteraceae bacterium]
MGERSTATGLFSVTHRTCGIDFLDAQHVELLAFADELHRAMVAGKASSMIAGFLERLAMTLDDQLATEEQVMIVSDYPHMEEHSRLHEEARAMLKNLVRAFESGALPIAYDTMHFVRHWVRTHVPSEDRRFADFLLNRRSAMFVRKGRWRTGQIFTAAEEPEPAAVNGT